ncbi:hypothetical protein PV08_04162 [Exophiala spinifera]|uniref:Thioesterase domain-containing protein n=1 Tax=Exophiala spinifera TaxID=91928 RepID=A0A0D1YP85_9EURO|nr:uncharacterized protein PV08_04162 [Exophiala spinifera]KIW16971.1 hypothetical protein PV08_04162 [Exophiala spinifera]
MKLHPDFNVQWCRSILSSNISNLVNGREVLLDPSSPISNSIFTQSLYTSSAIRAHLSFQRPTSEPDSIGPLEYCYLLSLGSGVDGKRARAHGGFNSLILNHLAGMTACEVFGSVTLAAATMKVDYKAPIDTPGVIFARGWAVARDGRKLWVRTDIEDAKGQLLARAKVLFINQRSVVL